MVSVEEFDQCVESLISGAVDVVNSVLPADTEFACHQCTSVLAQGNTNSSQKHCGKVHQSRTKSPALFPKFPLLHVIGDGCEISLANECNVILFWRLRRYSR